MHILVAKSAHTYTLAHSLHYELDTLNLTVSPPWPAGWVSPPSPAIHTTVFHQATVEEARPAPPSPSSHSSFYNSLTLIQDKLGAHSDSPTSLSLPSIRLFLYPPLSTQNKQALMPNAPGMLHCDLNSSPMFQLQLIHPFTFSTICTVWFHFWSNDLKMDSSGFSGTFW